MVRKIGLGLGTRGSWFGSEGYVGHIEAIVHVTVSWQAHMPPLLVQTQSLVSAERADTW